MARIASRTAFRGASAAGLACTLALIVTPVSPAAGACPNEALRSGPSAVLPDCRAYEQVSPPESAGQVFEGIESSPGADMFAVEEASSLRESLLFSTKGAGFLSPSGGGGRLGGDVWQAQRGAAGWTVTRHVTPAPDEAIYPISGGISADHSYAFIHVGPFGSSEPKGEFGPLYLEGGADYLGDASGHFELTGCGSLGCERYAQGRYISPEGGHVIFSTGKSAAESRWCLFAGSALCSAARIEPDAPPTGTGAVYERPATGGPTKVVSLLPGDVTPGAGEDAVYAGASADGSSIAFAIGGTLYVRVNGEETEKVSPGEPTFAGLSANGRYLFYESAGNIHRFDTESKADKELNSSGDAEMMNVSADGSHVYFISHAQLDGAKGEAGQPNVYVWSGGTAEFIATVLESDTEGFPALGNWTQAVAPDPTPLRGPGTEASRITPDGSTLVFESAAQLTAYGNAEHTEVYRWAEGEPLQCVSCNPSGASPKYGARLQSSGATGYEIVLNNLSEDGSRVFFETEEALVKADSDKINDSYEWRLPPGEGEEPELGLISSGHSTTYPFLEGGEQNTLFGITKDGRDAFFKSQDALVPGAGVGGTPAIYDARIGGGFPEPVVPEPCSEEDCKPPLTPPPSLLGAATVTLQGSGNVVARKPKRHHHRRHHAKHRRRCARKHHRRHCGKTHHRGARISSAAGALAAASSPPASPSRFAGPAAPEAGTQSAAAPVARASGEFENYGIKGASADLSTLAAAAHPDFTTELELNKPGVYYAAKTEGIAVKLPPGLYGNPNLVPRCSTGEFLSQTCRIDAQVGVAEVEWADIGPGTKGRIFAPLYNLAPPHPDREIARLGFTFVQGLAVFIDVSVRTAGDYGITATVHGAPSLYPLIRAKTIIWGDPADPSHNPQRLTPHEALQGCHTACEAENEERPPEKLSPVAFMTNPSACGPISVGFEATSYQLPGRTFSAEASAGSITDCHGLPFAPSFEAEPTSPFAGAPTGLKTVLRIPQGNHDPTQLGTATMREARVTLPEGMTISPAAADGLGACSPEEVHLHEEVDAACPDNSKLGTLKITSPALATPLEGAVYQRAPTSSHLFGLWLVVDQLGLHIKLPGEIEPDPDTGQLTAVFADLPQVPVEEIELNIWGGPRAPLKNPDACGTYNTTYSFTPHSEDAPVTGSAPMAIERNCGPRGFAPKLGGGSTDPRAGHYSPFVLDLLREAGEEDIAAFKVTLPKGLLAKLRGVALCPETAAPTGACPPASQIGTLSSAAGPGPAPLWLPQPGKPTPAVYLAGPYNQAPYSAVSVVPAQAGPFDLGNVVVRSPLRVDPETARVTVEARPLPQIIAGVPISYRRVHVVIDRPAFTRNPTDCKPLAFASQITSKGGAISEPALAFQVDGCRALAFKPRLTLALKGPTHRAAYPALRAVLRARPHDAGLKRISVALPRSEFLAQEHISTICTRVRFAAHRCPKGSVYGHAVAWSPLLDKPLKGPVYLRSSNHRLPDLVLDLRGQIEVAVVGRIDSHHGGIRTTFEALPDAPVSRVVVSFSGGRKGLLTNSQDICAHKHRASAAMRAQNGRAARLRPALGVHCAKHKHSKHKP